jgi:hypothetical protein
MALIRCLGKITLPLAYRQYMKREVEAFKTVRKAGGLSRWVQEFLTVPGEPSHDYYNDPHRFVSEDGSVSVKPFRSQRLEAQLAHFSTGAQQHCCMTLEETSLHSDDAIDVKEIALLIPYQVSHCHYLTVEDEKRQLLPGHIYAFNQLREHSLLYQSEFGVWSGSKPCSILNVCFERKYPRNPNRY